MIMNEVLLIPIGLSALIRSTIPIIIICFLIYFHCFWPFTVGAVCNTFLIFASISLRILDNDC
jgi:hypothetical protein